MSTSSDAWSELRALRHAPPGFAGSGARRRVFGAALEQGQQLFLSAFSVGYEAKPLLLFYALSQAGRAISAASPVAGDQWQLQGHGVTCNNIGADVQPADLLVVNAGDGSFTKLANILKSPSLTAETTLAYLWGLLPDSKQFPLPGSDQYPATLGLFPAESSRPRDAAFLLSTPHVEGTITGLPDRFFGPAESRDDLATYLETNYPALSGLEILTAPGVALTDPLWGNCVKLRWTLDEHVGSAAARGTARNELRRPISCQQPGRDSLGRARG